MTATDAKTLELRDKLFAGQRLSFADGVHLDKFADLATLGEMANHVREAKNGNVTYYNVNQHLNPTNVCVYRCNFCAFRADLKSDRGYVMSDEQILHRAREATAAGATELHIVGGLHHQKPYAWYKHILEIIHDDYPELHLKAWTAVEWDWFQRVTKRPIEDLIEEMKEAGLGSLPGGGAEIFDPGVRAQLCEHKADGTEWLKIHRAAHNAGLRSNATMLYGHIETAEHRVDHLLQLRTLQDETGGFQTIIPLAFHPDNTRLAHIPRPTGVMDLRTMAMCRILLDNFPHVKAYWVMLTMPVAQVAQSYGADDIDGTVVHEKIYHEAGSDSPQEHTVADLRRLIREAGRDPVERDTLYNEVTRDPGFTGKAGRKLSLV
jgi:aminodeoxyfutalosine synthase